MRTKTVRARAGLSNKETTVDEESETKTMERWLSVDIPTGSDEVDSWPSLDYPEEESGPEHVTTLVFILVVLWVHPSTTLLPSVSLGISKHGSILYVFLLSRYTRSYSPTPRPPVSCFLPQ